MQEQKSHINTKVYFSRWSRKSYAIFSSLGKEVKISRLSIDICAKSLLKLGKLSMYSYQKLESFINNLRDLLDTDISGDTLEMMSILEIKEIKLAVPSNKEGYAYIY